MIIDEIKREFIELMENTHENLIFPKNYFGCMMAVLIEQKPTTQERIEELTGYSRATISQMLKLIQINFQIKKIKEPKIRKKYYFFDVSNKTFMLNFFEMIIDSYKDKTDFVLPFIENLELYDYKHPRFINFKDFLSKFHEMSLIYIKLFSDTKEGFKSLIYLDQVIDPLIIDEDLINNPKNQEFLQDILHPPNLTFTNFDEMSDDLKQVYLNLKNDFLQEFRENLSLGESQLMIARSVIGTEILLENRPITQVEIEASTKLARSLISDALKLLLDWGMVQLIKKPGDRKKYYAINQSWDSRLVNRLRVNKRYAINVKEKIANLIIKANQETKNEQSKSLAKFLQDIHYTYEKFEKYYELLELKHFENKINEHRKKRDK